MQCSIPLSHRVLATLLLCTASLGPAWAAADTAVESTNETAPAQAAADVASTPASAPALPSESPDSSAAATPPSPAAAPFTYQLGLAVVHGPAFLGESSQTTGLQPVWSLRWGRFRITSSRASLIEREPGQGALPGASMELGAFGRWRFDAALRLDTGQDRAEGADQAGLQSVSSTVRGRFTASYRMVSGLGAELALTTDLLNRGGGTTLGLDLSRRFSLSPEWRLNLGAGISLADAIHQRSRYGVSAEESVRTGLPRFEPGGGWLETRLSTGLTWQLSPRWRLGSSVVWGHLMGPATRSPLAERDDGLTVTVGAVYVGQP